MYVWMIFVLAGVALAGCSDGCENVEVSRSDSPDGRHVAVLFQRDCGATTGFTTQLSVIETGDMLPNDGGNVFIADGGRGAAEPSAWGGPWADVRWLTPDRLEIAYDPLSRTVRQAEKFDDIQVTYRPQTRGE
jgi:hypothetical protein